MPTKTLMRCFGAGLLNTIHHTKSSHKPLVLSEAMLYSNLITSILVATLVLTRCTMSIPVGPTTSKVVTDAAKAAAVAAAVTIAGHHGITVVNHGEKHHDPGASHTSPEAEHL